MPATYGPLVRLWGLQPSQLPPVDAQHEDLTRLLTSVLAEAVPFIQDVPAATKTKTKTKTTTSSPWKSKGVKKFPRSTAPVHLYERTVPAEALAAVVKRHHIDGVRAASETWVLRRSVHEDAETAGTATWDEFTQCFKDDHAGAEKEFTPTVLDTRLTQQWDCQGIEIRLQGTTWTGFTLKLEDSTHKMPAPLKNRVFPVLQVTAAARGRREFVVVQMAMRAGEPTVGDVLRAAYTSVERLRETEEGTEWVMGTASDAGGVLPGWVQRLAVPGQIAKDVDMFLGWILRARKGKGRAAPEDVVGEQVSTA